MCALCLFEANQQHQGNSSTQQNNIIVIDEAYQNETSTVQNFKNNLKNRQQAIARTLSYLEVQQDTYVDRVQQLRDSIEQSFAEIKKLVALQEADVLAAYDLSVRANAEDLANCTDTFRRYEADCEAYLKDVTEAINLREPTRILGVSQLSSNSNLGDDLDLGRPEEHSRTHELPVLHFDREEIISSLRNACKLFVNESGLDVVSQLQQKMNGGGGGGGKRKSVVGDEEDENFDL